jgi:hypothetical protein
MEGIPSFLTDAGGVGGFGRSVEPAPPLCGRHRFSLTKMLAAFQ